MWPECSRSLACVTGCRPSSSRTPPAWSAGDLGPRVGRRSGRCRPDHERRGDLALPPVGRFPLGTISPVSEVRMDFLQPTSWREALALRAERPDAVPIAGGTDVMVDINFDRRRPGGLLDLGRV